MQSSTMSIDITEYQVRLETEDATRNLNGTIVTREERNAASVCGTGTHTTGSTAQFDHLNTGTLFDSYSLYALSRSRGETERSSGQLHLGTCQRVREIRFNDSARMSFSVDSEIVFDVVRSGTSRKGIAPASSINDPSTAKLIISRIDGTSDSLQIEANDEADGVTVTIQESNAVVAFQSTWQFED